MQQHAQSSSQVQEPTTDQRQGHMGLFWRRRAVPPSPSWLRRVRRKVGGVIAYSVTFYRNAAK
jgi:hypothetical protein